MLFDSKDPRKVEPEDLEVEPERVEGDSVRELEEIHKLFDALAVPEGFAADRLAKWFEHKVLANRANGHQDSCQCQFCSEDRIVQRVLRRIRGQGV